MASSPISSITHTNNTTTTGVKDNSTIDNDDFMTLLFAQLKNQDPMKPMDSSEMMSQIATLNSLNALLSIKESISTLNNSQTLSYATSLIGKTINAVPDTKDTSKIVTGKVTSMTSYNGETLVQIGNTDVKLSTIVSVSNG
ncbi:MAG: hypothetical protein C0410_14115 [Anaerolinea sp.]|nr:hypothetical protein [Anaerolinea sp.]